MRVLINGLPLFASRLAKDLQEADPNSRFVFLDTYNSKLAQLKFLLLLPFSDCVISMNGVSDQSGSMDWVLRLKKKLIMQWMGTDVIIALDRYKKNTLFRKYIDYATHFADAPWLIEEVEQLGVKVHRVDFKYTNAKVRPLDHYNEIKVMSYVPQSRQLFYGLEFIVNAAKAFPDLPFHLYGMTKSEIELPENVILHTWADEEAFAKAVSESAIFLRLPEHDGYSASVIEAQGLGSEIIWTLSGEKSHFVNDQESLNNSISEIVQKLRTGGMKPNEDSIEFIRTNYNKSFLMKAYVNKIKDLVR